ncbi:phytanoyl-CoA dioxygenase family protein [Nocardia sp. NPDC004654]|uniref:phytanoyl-CoA dioxygenase family protein n=1 Tax=Nocardia sp. NPDC004654 TaxID=3154776 RepID=UPI0033AC58B0
MASTADSQSRLLRKVSRSTDVREILQIVAEDGAVIIGEFLSTDQVRRFNAELDPALGEVSAGSQHWNPIMQEFHGANTKRMTGLVAQSPTFRSEILDDDLLHALGEGTFRDHLGDWWLSTGQVIQIGPGNRAQFLHRDNENYPAFAAMGKYAPEVSANLLVALTDFTDANGATRVLPGTHLADDFGMRGDPEETVAAEMSAGDALYFSGKVLHGGGANQTHDQCRRAVSIAVQTSFLTPEEAHALLIDRDTVRGLSVRVQKLLGFRSQYPVGSPGLWTADAHEIADRLSL